jgi:hypothetical protein
MHTAPRLAWWTSCSVRNALSCSYCLHQASTFLQSVSIKHSGKAQKWVCQVLAVILLMSCHVKLETDPTNEYSDGDNC